MKNIVPYSVRQGRQDPLPYVDGIPYDARPPVQSWILNKIEYLSSTELDVLMITLRVPYTLPTRLQSIGQYIGENEEHLLDALDYALQTGTLYGELDQISRLLESSHSKIKVRVIEKDQRDPFTECYICVLEDAVDEASEQLYLKAVAPRGRAEEHLIEAWHAAYGREKNAELVWRKSVKAVEEILRPVVFPEAQSARLGRMRNEIRQTSNKGKWNCSLPLWKDENRTSVDAFLDVLDRVTYEDGRHGGDAPDLVRAKAVLHTAILIVEWVNEGVFSRVDQK